MQCLVAQSCPILCNPMNCSPPDSSAHGDSPGKNTGVGCHALLQGIFPTEIKPWSPSLQVDSLPSELPGKPMNTGGDSLYLFQGIFPTQKSNQGLLHWKWILYQMSYQGLGPLYCNIEKIYMQIWEIRMQITYWEICIQVRKQQLEPDMELQTGSKSGKEYVKAVSCHPAYLTYMQSTSWEMPGWMKNRLE